MSQNKFIKQEIIKKFYKKGLIIVGLLVLIGIVLIFMSGTKAEAPVAKDKVDSTFSGVTNNTPNPTNVIQQHFDNFAKNQEKLNKEYQQRILELESENQLYKKSQMENASQAIAMNKKLDQLNSVKINSSAPVASKKLEKKIYEDDINTAEVPNLPESFPVKELSDNKPAPAIEQVSTYIPSNSFVKGVLISALSANTGGNADAAPAPVLIRLTDFAQLPNQFRANVKSCMVGGSGFGDLSTERVKIRLTHLSCILRDGKAIDTDVSGYISGEDAKSGIKGMVVTHSGSIAAKAALAGFLEGLGTVGQAMGQTQTVTPLGGVTTTISPDQAGYAGAGNGLSKVGSTLSQYYMNMLQQISPAIEVSAGRHITVVFEKGVKFNLPINHTNIDSLPLEKD